MKSYLDCIPCLFKQVLDSSRMYSSDPAVHERIMREVMEWCKDMDMSKPIPVMGLSVYRRLRKITGVADPYHAAKARQNRMALRLLPGLRAELEKTDDPFALSMRIAIAGNIIDMGGAGDASLSGIRKALHHAMTEPLKGNIAAFRRAVKKAKTILYLTDNAGEIVFDRLLIEQLGPGRVTVAVRGAPALNDALLADARAAGLHKITKVIDNGSDAPGTIMENVSPQFKEAFMKADLVIAKGMGNYETLSEAPRQVYFLFKAKCPMVAKRAKVGIGSQVLAHSSRRKNRVSE